MCLTQYSYYIMQNWTAVVLVSKRRRWTSDLISLLSVHLIVKNAEYISGVLNFIKFILSFSKRIKMSLLELSSIKNYVGVASQKWIQCYV